MREGGAPALGVALLGVGEDEVDIGREVELAGAELAHAQHHQALLAAVAARRRAPPARLEVTFEPAQGAFQRHLGQLRHRGGGGPHVGIHRPYQVSPHDTQHARPAEAPQHGVQAGLILGALQPFGEPGRERLALRRLVQLATGIQVQQPFGVAHQGVEGEVGNGDDPRQLASTFRPQRQPVLRGRLLAGHLGHVVGPGQALAQALPRFLQGGPERGRGVIDGQEVSGKGHGQHALSQRNCPQHSEGADAAAPPTTAFSRRTSASRAGPRSDRRRSAPPSPPPSRCPWLDRTAHDARCRCGPPRSRWRC